MRSGISFLIFAAASLLYSLSLSLPFFTHGESREALVVTAMIEQNNYVLPLRNGVDIPSKPPLFHWTARALAAVGGERNEAVYRLPSALAAGLGLAIFFLFAAKRMQTMSAFLATVMLGSSMEWMRAAGLARVDMMFTLWVSAATWTLFLLVESRLTPISRRAGRSEWFYAILSIPLLAAATLTKGPAGIVLPWALTLTFAALRNFRAVPIAAPLISVAGSAAISGVWYYAGYLQQGQAFLDVQLLRENIARITGSDPSLGHGASLFRVPLMLLVGLLPWSALLPLFFAVLLRHRKRLFASTDPAVAFSLLWVAIYAVFFSLTASKRSVYLLPSFPAWAYLAAAGIDRIESLPLFPRALRLSRALLWVFVSGVGAVLLFVVDANLFEIGPVLARFGVKEHDIHMVREVAHASGKLVFLGALGALLLVLGVRLSAASHSRGILLFASGTLTLGSAVSLGAMPIVASINSPRAFLAANTTHLEHTRAVYQFPENYFTVNYYLGRRVPLILSAEQVTTGPGAVILVADFFEQEALAEFPGARVIARSEELVLDGKRRLLIMKLPD